jgi:site-specific DNA-methyltransferase (adenine-specific)
MGAIIWQKVTTTNTTGGATVMGSFPYPRNGILKLDYEFILIFKKNGIAPKVSKKNKELSRMTTEEWNTFFQGHWNFGGAKQDSHIAMFPEELPKRLIKMFSFTGDTILDPFLGSGTTSLAAKNLNRNSAGYEINSEFIPNIKEKLSIKDDEILKKHSFEFVKQGNIQIDFKKEIENQTYIFKDPHKLNKKMDVKKLQFGSKLDNKGGKREEYFTVKKIISPELLKLSNDLVVRLIGVKENVEVNRKAIEYLINKTKGQKVYLKYDEQKYDDKNRLLCYLYLQNKTFINAHLIKEKLAFVDIAINYKYKNKFLKLCENNKGVSGFLKGMDTGIDREGDRL